MADQRLYDISIQNIPEEQAKGLYGLLLGLGLNEPLWGHRGSSWSGAQPHRVRTSLEPARLITIEPVSNRHGRNALIELGRILQREREERGEPEAA